MQISISSLGLWQFIQSIHGSDRHGYPFSYDYHKELSCAAFQVCREGERKKNDRDQCIGIERKKKNECNVAILLAAVRILCD